MLFLENVCKEPPPMQSVLSPVTRGAIFIIFLHPSDTLKRAALFVLNSTRMANSFMLFMNSFCLPAPARSGGLSDDPSDLSHHHQMFNVQRPVPQNKRWGFSFTRSVSIRYTHTDESIFHGMSLFFVCFLSRSYGDPRQPEQSGGQRRAHL